MKYLVIILSMVFISNTLLTAQKRCNTSEFEVHQNRLNPLYKEQKKSFEHQLQSYINHSKKNAQDEIITIPVVFHVLYQNDNENIGKANLESQIKVLNNDFRRKNSNADNTWAQAADTKIRFSLSNVDINGNYFNGITRTATNVDFFDYQTDSIFLTAEGGKDIWPGYLNIYVCDLDVFNLNVGGYSSLPGYDPNIDGVVLDYRVTGNFSDDGVFGEIFSFDFAEGRTGTHEVGHWLNLEHLWGPTDNFSCMGQDDGVADTPLSLEPYTQCDTGSSCGSADMADNFMDYHNDACMRLFTEGQAERMHNSIDLAPSRRFLKNPCHQNATKQIIKYELSAESENVQAIDTVYAINSITDNANVMYEAGQIVMLETGFNVDASSDFLADIKTCQ